MTKMTDCTDDKLIQSIQSRVLILKASIIFL